MSERYFLELFLLEEFFFSFIISSFLITEWSIILAKYFPFLWLHVPRYQIWSFLHKWSSFRFVHSHQHLLSFQVWLELHFLLSILHLQSHDVCFANVFDLFFHVIKLKMRRFKSSVLFERHTLLDRSLRVLKIPTYLSKLNANWY